mmetsp:Transcript_39353/g.28472  ORF Transcript_39353/g.28472 Transcript_39353/m.28472 type:complete len:85 (+) Transcript_39353:71-325(+)
MGELFLLVADEELAIENQRQKLASYQLFETFSAFSRIDRDTNDYITCSELRKFLVENNVTNISETEVNYMIKFFDADQTGRLSF